MTCQECQIELFDDSPGRDALMHVAECEDCHTLARDLRANAQALAALRGEELAARPFVHPRRFPWPVIGVAAAAALVFALGLPRALDQAVPVPVAVQSVPSAPSVPSVPAPAVMRGVSAASTKPPNSAVTGRASRDTFKPRPEPEVALPLEAPAQPLLVKMLTPDPDVVIYWLIDPEKGA